MLFNSYSFLIFFPIVCLIYFTVPSKYQYICLLISSYIFYMCWNVLYVLLLLFISLITWCCGILLSCLDKDLSKNNSSKINSFITRFFSGKSDDPHKFKKIILVINYIFILSILFLFKYYNFAIDNINKILVLFHVRNISSIVNLLLPVGISFYTFQSLGYLVDVYRGKIPAEKNFFKFALFVSFFPQLVAGPIERSKNLMNQLVDKHTFNYERMRDGLLIMLWGYFLKLVIADRAAIFVDTVYGDFSTYGGWYIIIANILFAIQIYCDFAGYSTIAVGAAKIMGIHLMDNFKSPYLSLNITEFWRNWHISLTSWFRDYLYIPLGGNRHGKWRKYLNTLIVFTISGLWHGANWSYVIWGMCNGLYLIAEEILKSPKEGIIHFLKLNKTSIGFKALSIITTFIFVDITWVFFRAQGLSQALQAFKSMFTLHNSYILFNKSLYTAGLNYANYRVLMLSILILIIVDFLNKKGIKISKIIVCQDIWCRWLVYLISIMFILIFGIWGPSYEASNFIYFQF